MRQTEVVVKNTISANQGDDAPQMPLQTPITSTNRPATLAIVPRTAGQPGGK
jgi:hypothetical protein